MILQNTRFNILKGVCVVACVIIRKSENQTRVRRSTKEGYVTFMKNYASSLTKIRSRQITNVKGRVLFL